MSTAFDDDRDSESSHDSSGRPSSPDIQVGDVTTTAPEFQARDAVAPRARGTAPDVPVVVNHDGETDPGECDLAAALAAGDRRRVMTTLVEAHGEHVYCYCRRILGTDAESDDASQKVFEQAFQCLQDLPRVRCVRAWLLRIARNRCIDRLRASRRDPRTLEHRELSAIIDRGASNGAGDRDPWISKALDECLDRLDSRRRAVLVLRFRDGLSFTEISELMRETEGALRVRLVRALSALRKCLEGKGVRPCLEGKGIRS
jgi:RNA polymerase sigma-70 factor (ECF subfamily)